MGLTPGTVCRVYAGGRCGPCRIRVRETDVVIGHGMAEKIMASEVENQAGGEKQQSG
jgi:ferrous iron transport protein A